MHRETKVLENEDNKFVTQKRKPLEGYEEKGKWSK